MTDCICTKQGGPEGCGLCNETGSRPPTMSAPDDLVAELLRKADKLGCDYWRAPALIKRAAARIQSDAAIIEGLRAGLTLAANRMDRLVLEVQFDTRLRGEAADWITEARSLIPDGGGKDLGSFASLIPSAPASSPAAPCEVVP